MSTSTGSINKPGGSLKDRLEQVRRELAAERKRADRTRVMTLLIAIVALLLIGGYFAYGYSKISELTDHELLLNAAEDKLDENVPQLRDAIEGEVKRSAPVWAETLSKQAMESLPTAREKLEQYAMQQFEEGAKQAAVQTEKEFREFLKKNRPMLESKFKELSKSPKLADESVAQIEQALNEQLEGDLQQESGKMLEKLRLAHEKLRKLATTKKLTPEEQAERQVLAVARALQLQEAGTGATTPGGTSPRPPVTTRKPPEMKPPPGVAIPKTNEKGKAGTPPTRRLPAEDTKASPPAKAPSPDAGKKAAPPAKDAGKTDSKKN